MSVGSIECDVNDCTTKLTDARYPSRQCGEMMTSGRFLMITTYGHRLCQCMSSTTTPAENEVDIGVGSYTVGSVIPLGPISAPLQPGEGSRKEMFHRRAREDKIFTDMARRVLLYNEHARFMAMTSRVAQHLASVPRLTNARHCIVIDDEGSYVLQEGEASPHQSEQLLGVRACAPM